MRELPSGRVTFLFTDIEGSTRLLEELGQGYGPALTAHRAALREACGAHGGVEVDNQGDAFLFVFQNAPDAVAAAIAGQAALEPGPVRVRMGLHTGTPLRTDEGYFGRDVNVGARVAASAHGRQVVMTKATHDSVTGVTSRDLGEHRVKDVDEPVWIYQLGDEPFPPLMTISNTNLPRPTASFVGRDRETTEVAKLIGGSRLVTLTGPGGMGKTRLAVEAAGSLVGDFRNGVYWVDLAAVRDPAAVLPTIAQTIGAQGDLAAHLGARQTLLVLDNFEQVVEAGSDLAALAERCPRLHLLVTSRELLRVRGETEYEVFPLAELDAVHLFCLRSGLPESPDIKELCQRLDNMPLALELAAARTNVLTPREILSRLSRRLDLFKGGRDADERQRTLRATIAWSHDLLAPPEQALFARLGVFVGGCTLEAAEAVADADLDRLQSLVEKSLLRFADGRFRMLETIREFAVERLEESGDAAALHLRHAEYMCRLAEAAGMNMDATDTGRRPQPGRVIAEQANIRGALDWCAGNAPALGLSLMSELESFWVLQNPFEGARRLADLLERAPWADPLTRARALRCLGGSRYMANDVAGSLRANEEALELYRREGDERGVATMLFRLGTSRNAVGELEQGRALLHESLVMSRRLGMKVREVEAAGNLARLELEVGDSVLGRRLVEENIELAREVGFPWWVAGAEIGLAFHSLTTGDLDDAERRATVALKLAWELTDRAAMITCLGMLAAVAAARGDPGRAGQLWGAIKAEEQNGPAGHGWESSYRPTIESLLKLSSAPAAELPVAEGAKMAFAEAVQSELGRRTDSDLRPRS